MNTQALLTRLEAPEPPARVRLWRAGPNPGDYGDAPFTPRAAELVMAMFEKRQNLGAIDIEHNSNPQANPELDLNHPPVTGGYYALEVVDTPDGPELWMNPQWSDCRAPFAQAGVVCCAKHQIESKQRNYLSTDWDFDEATGEPIMLNRVALVHDPGLYGASLLASRASARRSASMDEKQIRQCYATAKAMAEGADGDMKTAASEYVAKLAAAAKALGMDLEAEPAQAAAETPQQGAQAAAEGAPPPPAAQDQAARAAAEEPKPKPDAGLASRPPAKTTPAKTAGAAASGGISRDELEGFLNEREEKTRLLEANKDRLGAKRYARLASRAYSLEQVRAEVGELEPPPLPAGTGGDTGGAIPPRAKQAKPWLPKLSPEQNLFASRMRDALGVTEEQEQEFEKRIDSDGGVTVSIVALTKQRAEARKKARAATA